MQMILAMRARTKLALLFGGVVVALAVAIARQEPDFDPWADY